MIVLEYSYVGSLLSTTSGNIVSILGISSIITIFSYVNKRYFEFVFRSYNLALAFVDAVIFNEYGISFS